MNFSSKINKFTIFTTSYIKNNIYFIFYINKKFFFSICFRITVIKTATGRSRNIAEENAARIQYTGVQKDSILLMDKGIAINKTDKFRNQRVILTIYVPAGKRIKVDKSIS
jgi:hypothetical protein